MVQTNESAMSFLSREVGPSSLRPTVYRPSRPLATRVSDGDTREVTNPHTRTDEDRSGVTRRTDRKA